MIKRDKVEYCRTKFFNAAVAAAIAAVVAGPTVVHASEKSEVQVFEGKGCQEATAQESDSDKAPRTEAYENPTEQEVMSGIMTLENPTVPEVISGEKTSVNLVNPGETPGIEMSGEPSNLEQISGEETLEKPSNPEGISGEETLEKPSNPEGISGEETPENPSTPEEMPGGETPENPSTPEEMPGGETPENPSTPGEMPGGETPENPSTPGEMPGGETPESPSNREETPGEETSEIPSNPEKTPEAERNRTAGTIPAQQISSAPQAIAPKISIENTPHLFHTVDKQYALVQVNTWLNVREGKGIGSRIVGTIRKGGICCVIADEDSDWIFIESGDVRGFVSAKYLLTGKRAEKEVKKNGEKSYVLGEEKIAPWDNAAYCYSYDTVKLTALGSEFRNALLSYAQNFLGNPYVWGGTSLTNGCDCSGFVQQIYAKFNYELPRTSREQAKAGERLSDKEAKPGDLLFYQTGSGYIYHVMLYLGNGKVVHASSEKTGIIISDYNYAKSTGYAVRIIEEDEQAITVNTGVNYIEPEGEFLGKFKLTAYCNCAECCGKWADGLTASGTVPTQARTVAMAGVPFGTRLNIGGQIFTVEDRGTPYGHVDIYMNLHSDADEFGVQYANVFIQK